MYNKYFVRYELWTYTTKINANGITKIYKGLGKIMDKKVLDYIVNLEQKNVRKKHGKIVIDNDRVTKQSISEEESSNSSMTIYKFLVDDTPVYAKAFGMDSPLAMGVSRMFNKCEIATPITSPMITSSGEYCLTASQDVHEVGKAMGLDSMTFREWLHTDKGKLFRMFIIKQKPKSATKYILTDKNEQDIALEFMSQEAIDEIVTISLLQELVTYTDGHAKNFIAFTNKDNNILQHIIPIDLEFNELLCQIDYKNADYEETFDKFLKIPYFSTSSFNIFDNEQNYPIRLKQIRKLLNKGRLNDKQIKALKTALQYDLSENIKTLGKQYKEPKIFKPTVELSKHLWEYNRNTIGRDLGM